MSEAKPISSVANRATFSFSCQVQTRNICQDWKLGPDGAFVRGVTRLYLDIRKTQVDKSQPLTEDEILPQVLCATHARGIVPIFPIKKMLGLMARWQEENHQRAEKETRRLLRSVERELQPVTGASAPPAVTKGYAPPANKKFGPPIQRESGKRKKADGKKKGSGNKQPKQQKRGH